MLKEKGLFIEDEACTFLLVSSSTFSQYSLYERHLISYDDGPWAREVIIVGQGLWLAGSVPIEKTADATTLYAIDGFSFFEALN